MQGDSDNRDRLEISPAADKVNQEQVNAFLLDDEPAQPAAAPAAGCAAKLSLPMNQNWRIMPMGVCAN